MQSPHVVLWQGRPLLVATLDVDLRGADAWNPGVRSIVERNDLRYFVLSYLPGRMEWGLGISPKLMMCLHQWLSGYGVPLALVDDLTGQSPLVPTPLERWGPVGPREWTYWLPAHLDEFAPGVWLALPAALTTGSASTIGEVYAAAAPLGGDGETNEGKGIAETLWTEGRLKVLLGIPDRLRCGAGQQTGLLLGAHSGALSWETLGAGLRKACESLGIDYVEESVSRQILVRFDNSTGDRSLPPERYFGRRFVISDVGSLSWRKLTCPCPTCLSKRDWQGVWQTLWLCFIGTFLCILWPYLFFRAAKRLWDRLTDVWLAKRYWRARLWPLYFVNWLRSRKAFPRTRDRGGDELRRYVLHLEQRRSDEWDFWYPVPLYRSDVPGECAGYGDFVAVAAALQRLGECVCPVADDWDDLFRRLSGKTSLEAVRQPRENRLKQLVGWSTVVRTRDLRWVSACLVASGPHSAFAKRILKRGVDPWAIPFLHGTLVIVDGQKARLLTRGGRLARLLDRLRTSSAYRKVLAGRVRAIAFHYHYVAVGSRWSELFLCALRRAATATGGSLRVASPHTTDRS